MSKVKHKKPKKITIQDPKKETHDLDYPVFCFKHLKSKPDKDFKFFTEFIIRLQQLCTLGWTEINKSDRHSFGTEMIPVKQFKSDMPSFVTPDVEKLMVFRANGDKRPFAGIRRGYVFHIIFIEEKFGDVYDHKKK